MLDMNRLMLMQRYWRNHTDYAMPQSRLHGVMNSTHKVSSCQTADRQSRVMIHPPTLRKVEILPPTFLPAETISLVKYSIISSVD